MTANASVLQSLLMKAESAWGETATSMASAIKITVVGGVKYQLDQQMIEPGRTVQYLNEITKGIPGPMSGSISFDVYLTGHGASTSGATAVTDLGTLLGVVLGGSVVSFAAGTTDAGAGASTSTNIVTAASGTGAPGGLFRVGAKGDAGGDGQWNVIDTHTLTALVPEFALPAAPANGAVVYSAENVYTIETPTSGAITGQRFQWFTANTQWTAHGCYPTAISITGLNPGEIPKASITFGVSWFEPRADSFPEATALTTFTPAPVAAGSFNLQTYGTTTRNALSFRSFSVDLGLGVVPIPGPDGNNAYQKWVGATRTPTTVKFTVVIDAGAASTSPTYWTNFLTNNAHHALASLSTGIGSAIAIYFAYCVYDGPRPTQIDSDGLNRVSLMFRAGTDTAETASDLSLSAFRLGLG